MGGATTKFFLRLDLRLRIILGKVVDFFYSQLASFVAINNITKTATCYHSSLSPHCPFSQVPKSTAVAALLAQPRTPAAGMAKVASPVVLSKMRRAAVTTFTAAHLNTQFVTLTQDPVHHSIVPTPPLLPFPSYRG